MYSESRGFYYEADLKGISDAQENVRKAKVDKEIYDLQKQITKLQESMEEETKAIDEQIKSLQKYQKEWSKVSSTLEKEINRQRAIEILGQSWEQDILNQRMDVLKTFTEQYVDLQKKQKQAYLDARNAELNGGTGTGGGGGTGGPSYNPKIDDDGKGVDNVPNIDHYEYKGKSYSSLTEAQAAKQADVARAGDEAYKKAYDEAFNSTSLPDVARRRIAEEAAKKARQAAIDEANKEQIKSVYAKFNGTDSAEPGETLVGELGPEIVLHKNGTASVVKSPTLMDMEGGEKVFNAEETEKILKSKYVPLKNFNPNKFKLLHAFANGTQSAQQTMLAAQAVGIANGLNKGLLATSSVGGQTINQTFNVSLPNITDSSKASELFKEFEQLQRRATQYFTK